MRKSLLALVALLVVPSLAFAQAAAGKWMGETQGRGGTQQVTLQLKVDGGNVMGTFQQGEQEAAEISNGKVVDANTITFSRMLPGRGGGEGFTINYTGAISGSEMTLTREAPEGGGGRGGGRGGGPITLKKM
jgi:hypothetical protein